MGGCAGGCLAGKQAVDNHCAQQGSLAVGFKAQGYRAYGSLAVGFKAQGYRAYGSLGFRVQGYRAYGSLGLGVYRVVVG